MTRLADWTSGHWAVAGLYGLLVVAGLAIAAIAYPAARRRAERDGELDEVGEPVWHLGNNPGGRVRAGLIIAAIGAFLLGTTLLRALR